MAGNQLSLEILIKTIADARGLKTTQDQIKGLANEIKSARDANGEMVTSSKEIGDALEKVAKQADASASAWEKMGDAEKQAHRDAAAEAVKSIEANEAAAAAKRKNQDAAKGLGKDLGALRQAGQGLNQVFTGLATGGIGGTLQAMRGMTQVVSALRGGLSQLARGFSIAGVAAGPVIVATKMMEEAAENTNKEMQRMWDTNSKASEAHAKAVEANSARAIAALTKLQETVRATIAAYSQLEGFSAQAEARNATLMGAQKDADVAALGEREAKALAAARTPEQRERIKKDFALQRSSLDAKYEGMGRDNKELQADVRIRNAQEQQAALRARDDAAAAAVRDAESEFETKKGFAKSISDRDPKSAAAIQANKDALAAQDALKRARENQKTIRAELSPAFDQVQRTIDEANLTKQVSGMERGTKATNDRTRLQQLGQIPEDLRNAQSAAGNSIADIQARIKAEEDRSSRSRVFNDQADTAGLERELEKARAEAAEVGKLIESDAKLRAKESAEIKRRLKAEKERSGGG